MIMVSPANQLRQVVRHYAARAMALPEPNAAALQSPANVAPPVSARRTVSEIACALKEANEKKVAAGLALVPTHLNASSHEHTLRDSPCWLRSTSGAEDMLPRLALAS